MVPPRKTVFLPLLPLLCAAWAGCAPRVSPAPPSTLSRLNRLAIAPPPNTAHLLLSEKIHLLPARNQTLTLPLLSNLNVPAVLGQINGHLIPLILDTGAANVPLLLEAESAAHAKIRPLRGVYLRGSGIGGSIRVGVGQFDSLQLAGQQILGPGHAGILLQTYSETVAGIRVRNLPLNLLGMKALKHFSYVAIDGPKKQVEFGVGHPYQPATGERFFQFKIRREGPSVDLKVGDQTMQVLLDTGCSSPLSLNASDFKNIPPDFIADTPTHAQKSMGVAGLETSRRGLLKEVAVGGIRIAPISFDSTATGTDPLLGWGAFRNRRIVLDFVEHRVWVTLQR